MRTLQHGDRGDAVKIIQQRLKDLGIFTASVGGNFLDKTEAAVKEFQKRATGPTGAKVGVTGRVDGDTWWALYEPGALKGQGAAKKGAGKLPPAPDVSVMLKHGDRGEDVKVVQQILKDKGYFTGAVKGNYLNLTERAVSLFQMQNSGPDGLPLQPDGIVGPATWWALRNKPGTVQKGLRSGKIPKGLTPVRQRILEVALAEEAKGIKEKPADSNRHPEIDKYSPGTRARGVRGPAWCCFFWSWVTNEATGKYPSGRRLGRVETAWQRANSRQIPGVKRTPIPGDAYVVLRPDRTGHIGFVLRVGEKDGKALEVNTIEGNTDNRLMIRYHRPAETKHFRGFIRAEGPKQPPGWERGGLVLASTGKKTR